VGVSLREPDSEPHSTLVALYRLLPPEGTRRSCDYYWTAAQSSTPRAENTATLYRLLLPEGTRRSCSYYYNGADVNAQGGEYGNLLRG
jgi:hypothetical protein